MIALNAFPFVDVRIIVRDDVRTYVRDVDAIDHCTCRCKYGEK